MQATLLRVYQTREQVFSNLKAFIDATEQLANYTKTSTWLHQRVVFPIITRSTAIGYGSRVLGLYVLQYFGRFPNYEHFGFQGLHVANGGENRSFHLMEGPVPIRTSGLVR